MEKMDLFPIISSVAHLKQGGKIFVDSIEQPTVVFVIHKSAMGYLLGEETDYYKLLTFLHNSSDIPQYFHFYDASEKLLEAAKERTDYNIKIRKRMRGRRPVNEKFYPDFDINGFTAKMISEENYNDLAVFNLNIIGKYWNTVQDFVNAGPGWIIYDDGKPICVWYIVSIVDKNAEGDIVTSPDYRGRGLATIAGTLFLKSMDELGINQDWDVFIENTPIVKIGEKLGFKPYYPYEFLSMYKLN